MSDEPHLETLAAEARPGSIVWAPGDGAVPYGNDWLQTIFARLFPAAGLAARDEQLAMANFVETGLVTGRHVLAEAGVGTGKTLAYLIPLVGHLLRHGGPVVIATHTIALQDQLIRENIPQLSALLDAPLEAVLAKGRDHYVCPARVAVLRDSRPAPGSDESRLIEWAARTETGDRGELPGVPDSLWREVNWGRKGPCTARCRHAATCPSARQRQRYHETRGIIVTNHHQFFADMALRAQGHPLFLPPTAVVLDEAHAIFDAARDSFGHRATLKAVATAIQGTQAAFPPGDEGWRPLLEAAEAFTRELRAHVVWEGGDEADRYAVRPDAALLEAAARLRQGTALMLEYLDGQGAVGRRAARALGQAIAPVTGLLEPDTLVAWAEGSATRREVTAIGAAPRSLAGVLGQHLFGRGVPVVCTSATLSLDGDFGYFERRAGVEDALTCHVGTPFDYTRQARLYMPDDLPDPRADEDAFYAAALERLKEVLEATQGRALVLYTARARAEEAYRKLKAWKRFPVYHQARVTPQVIDRFKADTRSVLLGTAFWEGIDIPGETLSCVVVVKLPFPAGDPLVAAREADARAAGEDPFVSVLLPEMLTKLRQGAGRLIRSPADRGVIAVLDPRAVTREGYADRVRASLPPAPIAESLDAIRAFLAVPQGRP